MDPVPADKDWWKSKTFWVNTLNGFLNLLTLVGLLLAALSQEDIIKENLQAFKWVAFSITLVGLITNIVTVTLRWLGGLPLSRMFVLALMLFSLVANMAQAQELRLPAKITAAPGTLIILAPEIVSGGKPKYRVSDPALQEVRLDLLFDESVLAKQRGKIFTSAVPGKYLVEVWNALGDVPSDIVACEVTILGTPPTPPGPTPPGPTPPGPTPDPNPPKPGAPIQAPGFKVIFMYETGKPLPEGILQTIVSSKVRKYLDSHTSKDPNGQPGYRLWDDDFDDVNFKYTPDYLHKAYFEAKTKKKDDEPWIIVSDGTKNIGESVSMPKSTDEVMALLQKYGGP